MAEYEYTDYMLRPVFAAITFFQIKTMSVEREKCIPNTNQMKYKTLMHCKGTNTFQDFLYNTLNLACLLCRVYWNRTRS